MRPYDNEQDLDARARATRDLFQRHGLPDDTAPPLTSFVRVAVVHAGDLVGALYRGEPNGEGTFIALRAGTVCYVTVMCGAFLIPGDAGPVWPHPGEMLLTVAFTTALRRLLPGAELGWYETLDSPFTCTVRLPPHQTRIESDFRRRRVASIAADFGTLMAGGYKRVETRIISS